MEKIIIIKYGELTTKKDNINYFLSCLKDNIRNFIGDDASIKFDRGRMFITSDEEKYEEILNKLKCVFGIHEINLGYKLDSNDIETIENNLKELIQDKSFNTFKVETKRSYKNYPMNSMEVSKYLGGVVLKTMKTVSVDVHNPEVVINIEIRDGSSYIYFDKIEGIGGYPVGSLGKGMLMLSGGIDSPVAGYLALKRGVRIEGVYFESPPHTSEAAKNKVMELTRKLTNYSGYVKLHVVNFTNIQETIYKNVPHEYLITIMRRMMYRISERLAKRNNCKVIINGESIGQVASQTLTSMASINSVTNMPVIRPVACLDKLEIIDIAKKIDTYETSILPYEDCCTIFLPTHPVINPELNKCILYESNFDYESLIDECIENIETITNLKEDTNNELL